MKGQPPPVDGVADPYDAIADAYDRLDDWIIENWGEQPRPVRADFLCDLWADQPGGVDDVLEVCCGTGLMLEQLALRERAVAGLDRSAAMLRHARKRLGDDVPLIEAELPAIPLDRRFDAVISCGAALNYLSCPQDVAATFRSVARVLRPGGSFAFDILGRAMLDDHVGGTVWAADLGDLAFVWEFADGPAGAYCDATYTQFLHREGAPAEVYDKAVETHRLYPLNPEVIRAAAAEAGLADARVHDNYTRVPAHAGTLYETWTFTRR